MTYLVVTTETTWRATGTYSPKLASKASLVEEAKLFLITYARLGDISATSKALVDGVLPQRSRETRATIVGVLRRRLVLWNPPTWVLDDLVSFASDTNPDTLRVALLLHTSRQERLLYDFVQQVLVPHWYAGMHKVIRSDVQGFLDTAQEEHPEVLGWSYTTRQRLSNSVLTVLRDGRLLKGEVNKHIVAPYIPSQVARHLIHLLIVEGIAKEDIAQHPDWRLCLWDEAQAQKAVDTVTMQDYIAWRTV